MCTWLALISLYYVLRPRCGVPSSARKKEEHKKDIKTALISHGCKEKKVAGEFLFVFRLWALKPFEYRLQEDCLSAISCVGIFCFFFIARPSIKQYKIVQREEKKSAAHINHSIKMVFLKESFWTLTRLSSAYFWL